MASSDHLTKFVKEALSAGRTRADIGAVLKEAGWSDREIAAALDAFIAIEFTPPVPRPQPQLTARDAFIYLLLFTALAFVASYLISLIHGILDIALPDPAPESAWVEQRATDRVRWSIAALVVATPVFVWMMVHTRRQIAADPGQRRSLVRKWLTYLALFVAALVFFGDAVVVIHGFLKGDATLRFLLKALTIAAVTGAVFTFFLRDVEAGRDGR